MGVAIVNETLARRYLKGASPIGHTLGQGKGQVTIVGLVRDHKYSRRRRRADAHGLVLLPAGSQRREHGRRGARGRQSHGVAVREIRRIVRNLDPNAPVQSPMVLSAQFEETYLMPALFARLGAFFGGLAALLVAVGLYGTLAYRVSRRTLEIGVRMALGAARQQVLWMILQDSLILIAAGLAVGLPLAWFGSKLMASMLYKLPAHDPVSFVAAALGVWPCPWRRRCCRRDERPAWNRCRR